MSLPTSSAQHSNHNDPISSDNGSANEDSEENDSLDNGQSEHDSLGNASSDDEDDARSWSDSEEEMWSWEWSGFSGSWPRRLLHIPTLTSLERQDGNVYGNHRLPHYGILTYTWGRWRTSSGRALPVKNTTWAIPSVSADLFSVEEVENVVHYIGQEFDFVWIDVACIDQEDEAVKMDEIGNQMGIFKQARRVYAWLSRSSTETLQGCVDGMYAHSDVLREDVQRWRRALEPLTADDVTMMVQSMRAILHVLERIFADPWFSSLWTLQEAVLRRDARLLSHEGCPIQIKHENRTMLLVHFVARCSKIYDDVSRMIHDHGLSLSLFKQQPDAMNLAQSISAIIMRAGYHYANFCTNPNVQYSVAQFRETKYPLDRIYGIMQFYGFRLGAANLEATPRVYTQKDLEEEFARTLIEQSALLGQMFVHARSTIPRKSWQITQYCRVPYGLLELENPTVCCDEFSVTTSDSPFIKGQACFLGPLVDAWDRMARNLDMLHPTPLNGRIFLDDVQETHDLTVSAPKSDNDKAFANLIELTAYEMSTKASLLNKLGADNVRVFLLGYIGPELNGNREGKTKTCVGLLLLRSETCWKRIGICVWNREAEKAPPLPADIFDLENDMLKTAGLPLLEVKPPLDVEWLPFEAHLD